MEGDGGVEYFLAGKRGRASGCSKQHPDGTGRVVSMGWIVLLFAEGCRQGELEGCGEAGEMHSGPGKASRQEGRTEEEGEGGWTSTRWWVRTTVGGRSRVQGVHVAVNKACSDACTVPRA
jgi:hypothetical protein